MQRGIGWSVGQVVKEVSRGINDRRPKFLAVLANQEIVRIVVEPKDLTSGFGVASIQTWFSRQERELVVSTRPIRHKTRLLGDFVAILTSFCARLFGRRRAKRKT